MKAKLLFLLGFIFLFNFSYANVYSPKTLSLKSQNYQSTNIDKKIPVWFGKVLKKLNCQADQNSSKKFFLFPKKVNCDFWTFLDIVVSLFFMALAFTTYPYDPYSGIYLQLIAVLFMSILLI